VECNIDLATVMAPFTAPLKFILQPKTVIGPIMEQCKVNEGGADGIARLQAMDRLEGLPSNRRSPICHRLTWLVMHTPCSGNQPISGTSSNGVILRPGGEVAASCPELPPGSPFWRDRHHSCQLMCLGKCSTQHAHPDRMAMLRVLCGIDFLCSRYDVALYGIALDSGGIYMSRELGTVFFMLGLILCPAGMTRGRSPFGRCDRLFGRNTDRLHRLPDRAIFRRGSALLGPRGILPVLALALDTA